MYLYLHTLMQVLSNHHNTQAIVTWYQDTCLLLCSLASAALSRLSICGLRFQIHVLQCLRNSLGLCLVFLWWSWPCMDWLCSMAAVMASTSNCGCRSGLIMNSFPSKGLFIVWIPTEDSHVLCIHVVLVRSGSWEVAGRLDTFAIRPGTGWRQGCHKCQLDKDGKSG